MAEGNTVKHKDFISAAAYWVKTVGKATVETPIEGIESGAIPALFVQMAIAEQTARLADEQKRTADAMAKIAKSLGEAIQLDALCVHLVP